MLAADVTAPRWEQVEALHHWGEGGGRWTHANARLGYSLVSPAGPDWPQQREQMERCSLVLRIDSRYDCARWRVLNFRCPILASIG